MGLEACQYQKKHFLSKLRILMCSYYKPTIKTVTCFSKLKVLVKLWYLSQIGSYAFRCAYIKFNLVPRSHSVLRCYLTAGDLGTRLYRSSYECTWEIWRALKELDFFSVSPRASLTPLLCSPNFPSSNFPTYVCLAWTKMREVFPRGFWHFHNCVIWPH